MNCCAILTVRNMSRSLRSLVALIVLVTASCSAPADDVDAAVDDDSYELIYELTPAPSAGTITVSLDVKQASPLLREVRFNVDPERYRNFSASGEFQLEDDELRWYVPESGGRLSWETDARRQRGNNGHDAWLGDEWGLFRAERIIPRAITRTRRGANSKTTLRFDLPDDWSAVTQYPPLDGDFRVDNPSRRYDEPSGWVVIGRLGVRLDRVAGTRIVVAAPEDNGVRRLDIIAFLNWTLPEVFRLLPSPPERLTIVSAGDPMWRGGLSASQSLYLHSERPLVSENGTSTLLHEVMHVVLGLRSAVGADWIVEGLAEYYSIEILRRSGGLSPQRSDKALASIADWAQSADTLCEDPSKGPRTALAVSVFAALDEELRNASKGERSLDDVLALLLDADARVDLNALRNAAARVRGGPLDALADASLPGCGDDTDEERPAA